MLLGNKEADICTSLCHMVAVALIKATHWHQALSCGTAADCLKITCVVSNYIPSSPSALLCRPEASRYILTSCISHSIELNMFSFKSVGSILS